MPRSQKKSTQRPHHKYHLTGSKNYERHNLSLAGRENEVKMPYGSPIVCRAGSGCQVDSPTYNYKLQHCSIRFSGHLPVWAAWAFVLVSRFTTYASRASCPLRSAQL